MTRYTTEGLPALCPREHPLTWIGPGQIKPMGLCDCLGQFGETYTYVGAKDDPPLLVAQGGVHLLADMAEELHYSLEATRSRLERTVKDRDMWRGKTVQAQEKIDMILETLEPVLLRIQRERQRREHEAGTFNAIETGDDRGT